ncbi:sortase domain-containing protein [Nonomuraea typhae]|uniref:sortase domain-containing protein n=1 Tax=Nonomuraea typhae TaxID=2603600 RepID=UPI001FE433B3|nr:sortase [Nonomuraea typhae]
MPRPRDPCPSGAACRRLSALGGHVIAAVVVLTSCTAQPDEMFRLPVEAPGLGLPLEAPALGPVPGGKPPPGGDAPSKWPRPLAGELARAEPTRVLIPRLRVSAPLVVLGTGTDGTPAVPPQEHANVAGWYGGGVTPGERGSAVIAGQLDTRTGPAVFGRLGELQKGDVVGVARGDGTVAVFAVERLSRVAKQRFPAGQVYGRTRERWLWLVTCAGSFDQAKAACSHNLLVRASFRAAYSAADLR